MRNLLYPFLFVLALTFVACEPKPEPQPEPDPEKTDPQPVDDGMNHTTMVVIDSLFCNPERGLHKAFECHSDNPAPLTAGQAKAFYNAGYTLIHFDFYMEDYRDTLIEESYLEVVRQSMQALRDGYCKGIVRFAYTNSQDQFPYEAHEDLVLQHIEQIKPILQAYADVIYVMEAGFVGVWGEWYYTSDQLTNFKQNPMKDSDFVSRRHVLDALLQALPEERTICVRTPKFKMKCYGWTFTDTLTRAEAFSSTPKARLAFHDDAIMADNNDLGTFPSPQYRDYVEAETKYLIYGGESCPPGNAASCEKTLDQFLKMHICYLNNDYYRPTFSKWIKGGCLDQIKLGLGYRFEGRDVATTKEPKAGEKLQVKFSLVNVGYSAPKNPRDIEMLLINEAEPSEIYRVVPDTDPRFWYTDQMQVIEVAFTPAKAGSYKLYLNLPDPQPTLHDNPRYSIRLANENCWDAKTGYNYLTTINVE